jgi:hypothetical protein
MVVQNQWRQSVRPFRKTLIDSGFPTVLQHPLQLFYVALGFDGAGVHFLLLAVIFSLLTPSVELGRYFVALWFGDYRGLHELELHLLEWQTTCC